MKKWILSVVAAALVAVVLCAQGFAAYGDITVRRVKAYSDAAMTKAVGTIPRYTAIVVNDTDGKQADVNVNGVHCYIKSSALTQSRYDYRYKGYATLKRGSKVYQRPTSASKSKSIRKNRRVVVCAVKGDWVLVRSRFEGYYGFVRRGSLKKFTPAG